MLRVTAAHKAFGWESVNAIPGFLGEPAGGTPVAKVADYVAQHVGEVDDQGHRLVVRNGYREDREVITSSEAVGIRTPRVNDKRVDEITGERRRFTSAILPRWARRSPNVNDVLPLLYLLLYLHGLSTTDLAPVLEQFLGSAQGLSPAVIQGLSVSWQQEAKQFCERDLHDVDYVYVWVDGVYVNARLSEERACLLVMIRVRPDGVKEMIALTDRFQE